MDFFEQLEQAQEDAGKAETLDLERMREDWSAIFFGSEQGMRVFGDMLVLSDYFGTRFTGNSKQFFLEGLRYFVSQIIRFAGIDTPDGLHRLLRIQQATLQRRSKDNDFR